MGCMLLSGFLRDISQLLQATPPSVWDCRQADQGLYWASGDMAHLIDEAEVVADKDETAVERLDGICQRINALNVQMVRGLVQQQQVGALHADHAKHQPRLLPL